MIGDNPPPTPQVGQLWWESDAGNLFVWYDDGNSAQWVIANSITGPAGPPGADGASGIAEAPTDGKVYGRKAGAWAPAWVQMTQAAYDALTPKDANTLYVVVG